MGKKEEKKAYNKSITREKQSVKCVGAKLRNPVG